MLTFLLSIYNFPNSLLTSYLQAGNKKYTIGKESLDLAGNDVFLAH